MKAPSVFLGERLNDRNLIESIISSFYIVDYGFIKNVNPDKTIDVVHARRMKTTEGVTLPDTLTKRVEVLTVSGSGFSIKLDYQKGDKVLLLGLRDFVEHVDDVQGSNSSNNYMHYSRETLKALPLCIFNDDAKVQVVLDQGELTVKCKKLIVTGSSGSAALEVTP